MKKRKVVRIIYEEKDFSTLKECTGARVSEVIFDSIMGDVCSIVLEKTA